MSLKQQKTIQERGCSFVHEIFLGGGGGEKKKLK